MGIDGSTRSLTEVDPVSGEIYQKRLQARVNNFNAILIFLSQCNMDLKFIGSGELAKALVFYITEYITKQSLPTHVAFAALQYAARQNQKKFAGTTS